MRKGFLAILLLPFYFMTSSWADQAMANRAYVKSSENGVDYAKCIPEKSYGSKGKTLVYYVNPKDGSEKLIATYNWFSPQIYLMDFRGLVRLGPWQLGNKAQKDHLAIAFYNNGKLLKEYSTLDIAGNPDNISLSTSHYKVFERIIGFRYRGPDDFAFDVKATDGRTISFDIATGKIIAAESEPGPAGMNMSKAKEIAEQFLAGQSFKGAYKTNSTSISELKDYVEVRFERIVPVPVKGDGVVRVDKKTWEAKWIPSK